MENRDNILEEQIRNSEVEIPESLSPDKIEEMLRNMSPEEMEKRSGSEDVPVSNRMSESGDEKKPGKKSYKRVVLPIVLAASFLLVFSLGLIIGKGNLFTHKDSYDEAAVETDEAVIETDEGIAAGAENSKKSVSNEVTVDKAPIQSDKKNGNYKKAYEQLKNYKDMISDMTKLEYNAEDVPATGATEAAIVEDVETEEAVDMMGAADFTAGSVNNSPEFTDTNVRTEGVAESDIIKTDGKYIYEYDQYTEHLNIYAVKDGKIDKKSRINLLGIGISNIEMYVSGDRLIFIGDKEDDSDYYLRKTSIIIYDISDRENPELSKKIVQDGDYDSSRLTDGILYTFTRKSFDVEKLSRKKYETYIPEIDGKVLENGEVYIQDDICSQTYVVISAVDILKEEITGKLGILSAGGGLYVSKNSIFLTDMQYNWETYSFREETKITKLSFENGKLKYEASGLIPGYLNDDYSMDEYKGNLRLVTTYFEDYTNYNALYVLDENLSKLSVIKHLAEGETIRSARFMGDTAYFVTFRNTDPLFAVDLSDPENPEITDYLKIPGFSAYLHPYSDGLLLGIGYNADEDGMLNGLKLSMFDVSDPMDIKEVDKLILDQYVAASVLDNRKALMFDESTGMFGYASMASNDRMVYLEDESFGQKGYFTIYDYDEDKGFETLMEYSLTDSLTDTFTYQTMDGARGMIIDDYLYIVESGDGVVSFDAKTFEQIDEVH